VLSQSFEDDLERIYWSRRPGHLPAFFANLLPEGPLRVLLERSLNLSEADDLGLLAAVGSDLPGALSLRSSDEPAALMGVPSETVVDDEGGSKNETEGLRFSLAGVQMKFSMIRGDRFTLPAHDQRGDWIVKIGSNDYPGLVENEYAMLEWARCAGFDVPECLLVEADQIEAIRKYVPAETRALAIRRYDRDGMKRIHQEDFAQVTGSVPNLKYDFTYDQLAVLVRAIAGDEGYEELLRRLSLVIASGNNDAHLKNWSLLYLDGVTPSLAPLYDQVSTVAWPQVSRQLALKLGGARDPGRLSVDSFRRLARKAQADVERTVTIVRGTILRLREVWTQSQAHQVMHPAHIHALREHWIRAPFLRDIGELPQ
jgi:serine/threonine-protein kinase HipA